MKGQTRRSTPSTSLKTQYKLPQLKTLPLDAKREYQRGREIERKQHRTQ